MKFTSHIIAILLAIVLFSCSSPTKHEDIDYIDLIVGTWKSSYYNDVLDVQQGTEHFIYPDGTINSHFFYGGLAFRLNPQDHFRKWDIKCDTLFIIDDKATYKHLILNISQDSLVLQSIDNDILGPIERFVRD